jgi:hypothetical protein
MNGSSLHSITFDLLRRKCKAEKKEDVVDEQNVAAGSGGG